MKKYKDKAQHLASGIVGCCKTSKDEAKEAKELQVTNASVTLLLNGQEITVNAGDVKPTLSLARYIRDHANLKGTKISCNQGGCGACVVTAKVPDPLSGSKKTISVNSCLAPVLNCNGWEITTIEGLGNETDGMNPVQERLAAFHGTQCGYCSPGMVMQMNSLLEQKTGAPGLEEVENILDGNICRCTGYRPIFDAFKTFASGSGQGGLVDIEDAGKCKQACSKMRAVGKLANTEGDWYLPSSLADLLLVLGQLPVGSTYRLVNGNTGRGIFDGDKTYNAYISIKAVPELVTFTKSPLEIGAGMSLNSIIELFEDVASGNTDYKYCKTMADHIRKVAHTSVRNAGTVGGNLMLKHAYPEFPSDLFLLLETVGATLVIKTYDNTEEKKTALEFLSTNMDKKVLLKIQLPAMTSNFFSYKTMARKQNTHAYVNAALKISVDADFNVIEKPSLVFGGISESFVHATNTEQLLVGKNMKQLTTLQAALAILKSEVAPDDNPVLATPAYRTNLTQSLFYRFVLALLGDSVSDAVKSGAHEIVREISSGVQTYETDPSLYPVNQPIGKYEGKSQCTGEAVFVNDMPTFPGELCAAIVVSTVANCELDTVDPSEALKMPGVVSYVDYKDIPGRNSAIQDEGFNEELFSSGKVNYAGQAIGLIVANTFEEAHSAARAVAITYKNKQKPILTIKQALETNQPKKVGEPIKVGNIQATIKKHQGKGLKMIEGEFESGAQYHFYMESQSVIARPSEKGQMDIYSATQWMENSQMMVAQALGKPAHLINLEVRRLGGAYGGKTWYAGYVAAAAAVAVNKLKKPIRLVMDIRSVFETFGKRHPFLGKYQAGVDNNGKLLFVNMTIYSDSGFSFFLDTSWAAAAYAKNCYAATAWQLIPTTVATHTGSNTICRAPGTTFGYGIMENIMEHIASNIGMDPLEFRLHNMVTEGDLLFTKPFKMVEANPLPTIISDLKRTSNYDERMQQIQTFNSQNKWKKRGLSLVPMLYVQDSAGSTFYFQLTIYRGDGTIAISHGGVEMGQGIHTKVVQTVAKELGVPMDILSIKPNDVMINPNITGSWGSLTTDCVCSAAIIACKELKERMKEVEDTMSDPTWIQLVQECHKRGVDITAKHMGFSNREVQQYNIYSATITEVELDVLTGEMNIRRVDIVEDTGTSISPEIDVGQVEGAYVMALGLWLTEQVRYDPDTGKLLTFDTWEYKPPCSKDIPEDFRVTFYDGKRNDAGVLGAKAVGEQSLNMGVSVIFALRRAIDAVRKDLGISSMTWYNLGGPATPEVLQTTTGVTAANFIL